LKTYQFSAPLASSFFSWKIWVKDMGFSEPSTWYFVSGSFLCTEIAQTYQKCTGDQNNNAIVTVGLRIDCVGTVLDLLEWEVLLESAQAHIMSSQ
jgi:hypothetical protein